MRKQGWLAVGVCLLLSGFPMQRAEAQIFFGGATEITQILNHIQLLFSYVKQAQTALYSIQMAQMMVKEGINLAKHPSVNIAQDMMNLQMVLQQSQGLAGSLAQIDQQFHARYQPFTASPIMPYSNAYNTWATSTMNTIQGALRNAGMQNNMLNNQQLWMQQVELMNKTPMGQDQSIQLGNTIGLQTVKSLMDLQQLMVSNAVADQAVAAHTLNTQQASQQAAQNGFLYVPVQADQRKW